MISVRVEGKIFGSQSWCTNLAVFSNLRVNDLGFALKSFKTVNSSVGPLKLIFPSTLVQEILLLVSTSLSTMQNDWQGNFDFRSRRHHLVSTQTLQFICNIPPFFHSLVILAVPNGPVYELVLKGSALPKEDDKYDLTFFFYLLPFCIFVNYLISVRFFNRCNGWTQISLLLTYGFIAQYIVVHNHYLSKFGFSHSGFCSYNFFNYSSSLKVTSIILCKHP